MKSPVAAPTSSAAASPFYYLVWALPFFALALGLFLAPPLLFSDTSTGLLAWKNFIAGGTWNTLAEPSADNLALDIESPVTWWAPGQYAPLGALISLGLPLGLATLSLALLSALSLGLGLVKLARALGAPEASLPWVALAAVGSLHTLYAFGMFIGGEVMQIAVWPWIALAAWQLRTRPRLQFFCLPLLLLLGLWMKHSFMLWSLALLAFLWLEELRQKRAWPWAATVRLSAIFIIVFFTHKTAFFGGNGVNPGDPGQLERPLSIIFGFPSLAPALSAFGGGSIAGRWFFMQGLTFEEGWLRLGGLLALIAPVFLGLYLWLAFRPRPIERLAGVTCLCAAGLMAFLMFRGGSASLEDRHFRPAGVLLLVVLACATASSRRSLAATAKLAIIGIVAIGFASAIQRHLSMRRSVYPSIRYGSLANLSPIASKDLQTLAAAASSVGGVVYLAQPEPTVVLPPCRLLSTDASDREHAWLKARSYHGTVPLLVLALTPGMETDGRDRTLRESFADFPPDAWTRQASDGWVFWIATLSAAPTLPAP